MSLTELIVRLGRLIGLNPVQLRWKLVRLEQSLRRTRREVGDRVAHIRYEHKICPSCGAIQDRDAKVCTRCGGHVTSRSWQVLERVGLSIPSAASASSVLGLVMALTYVQLIVAEGGASLITIGADTLVRHGAHSSALVAGGEWWRLASAVLLHIGLWHLGFNLIALSQIGPTIEELYGRGLMLFAFMLTGILGNLASELVGLSGVSAGASGGVMGLIGLAAGWGQRDRTTIGKSTRNRMLKWVAYTFVFGVFVGANHVAHAGGLLSGAMLGYLVSPQLLRRPTLRPLAATLGILGIVAVAAALVGAVLPTAAGAVGFGPP